MAQIDTYKPSGYLEIYKIWNNSREQELVFSDKNTIVSGMGVGLSLMFSASGSKSIKDYQITKFQVGTSSHTTYGPSTYELASSIALRDYGAAPDYPVSSLFQWVNGSRSAATKGFGNIPFSFIRRASKTAVEFGILLGPNTANISNTPLKEVGLFMSNPFGFSSEVPILVAYKTFTPLEKTDQYSLLFRWTINF
jgi:hypothetical protein